MSLDLMGIKGEGPRDLAAVLGGVLNCSGTGGV